MKPPESAPRPADDEARNDERSNAGEQVDDGNVADDWRELNSELVEAPTSRDAAIADMRRQLAVMGIGPDCVREIRVLGPRGPIASGYFDSVEAFIEAVIRFGQPTKGFYVSLNPVNPALLARAYNRLQFGVPQATSDADVVRRDFVLLDFDPRRPSGISSTDAEHAHALKLASEARRFLEASGIPVALELDTGNGSALLLRVALRPDEREFVNAVLAAIAFRFNDQVVELDVSVSNPARLCRLAGTTNRKGDNIPNRPHRRARVLHAAEAPQAVERASLERLTAAVPRDDANGAQGSGTGSRLDVDDLLARNGIEVARSGPWQDGFRWVLETCQFNAEHIDRSAYVIQFRTGALSAGCHHATCRGKGWSEFNATLRHPASERSSGSGGSEGKPDSWPEPKPPPTALPPVPAFDPTLLPGLLRAWVKDVSERMGGPAEYVAVAILVVLATAIGRKLGIRPKLLDAWLVVVNLWALVVGRPGVLKTPALQEALQPLERLEAAARKKFDSDAQRFELVKLVREANLANTRRVIRERLEAGEEPDQVAERLILEDVAAPVRARYITNDPTVEKLGVILSENPNGVLVFRDEIVGLLKSLDKDGNEGARSFYLEAWNGTGKYRYDRIARGTIDIDAAIVSILGGVQPGPLGGYLQQTLEGGQGDDGLLQRFQLGVWPDISPEFVNVDRLPDQEARDAVFGLVEYLAKLDLSTWPQGVIHAEPGGIPFVHFADDAQPVFDAWRVVLERRLRSEVETPTMESHLAKYRSLIPSLALILHLADRVPGPVSLDALNLAIRWGEFLEQHARRIYAPALSPDTHVGLLLAKKILAKELKDGFVLRDVYRHCWSGLNSREAADRAARFLVDLDWLHEAKTKPAVGAPKVCYWINPGVAALSGKKATAAKTEPTQPTEPADRKEPTTEGGEGAKEVA